MVADCIVIPTPIIVEGEHIVRTVPHDGQAGFKGSVYGGSVFIEIIILAEVLAHLAGAGCKQRVGQRKVLVVVLIAVRLAEAFAERLRGVAGKFCGICKQVAVVVEIVKIIAHGLHGHIAGVLERYDVLHNLKIGSAVGSADSVTGLIKAINFNSVACATVCICSIALEEAVEFFVSFFNNITILRNLTTIDAVAVVKIERAVFGAIGHDQEAAHAPIAAIRFLVVDVGMKRGLVRLVGRGEIQADCEILARSGRHCTAMLLNITLIQST